MAGHGTVTVLAHMVNQTTFAGDWRSSIGTAGKVSMTKIESTSAEQGPLENQIMSSMPDSQGEIKGPSRTNVLISYSHQDIYWLERLRVHLKPLERDFSFDIWDDTNIKAGSKWLEEIEKAIQSAKIALLVISADFLASDFIAENELPPLLDAANKDGAIIMLLIVSPSRFKSIKSLSQFQAVNDPSRPLIKMTKGEQEEVLVKISDDIETILKPLLRK